MISQTIIWSKERFIGQPAQKTIYIARDSLSSDSGPKLTPKLVLESAYEGAVFKLMISQTIIWNFVFRHFFCHTVA